MEDIAISSRLKTFSDEFNITKIQLGYFSFGFYLVFDYIATDLSWDDVEAFQLFSLTNFGV